MTGFFKHQTGGITDWFLTSANEMEKGQAPVIKVECSVPGVRA